MHPATPGDPAASDSDPAGADANDLASPHDQPLDDSDYDVGSDHDPYAEVVGTGGAGRGPHRAGLSTEHKSTKGRRREVSSCGSCYFELAPWIRPAGHAVKTLDQQPISGTVTIDVEPDPFDLTNRIL